MNTSKKGEYIQSFWRKRSLSLQPKLHSAFSHINHFNVNIVTTLYLHKRQGRDVHHPSPSSAEVKERVELYFYFPFDPP